jgi:hemerythrin
MAQLEKALGNNEKQTIITLVSFLKDWFLEHILVEDTNYANYMLATMDEEDILLLVAFGYE